MDKNISVKDFVSRLNSERDALRLLVSLLEAEQKILIDGNVEQLLALSDSKINAVQELGGLANARKNFLLAHDSEIKAHGLDAWLQAIDAVSLPIWQDIQKTVEQMQNFNRTNGTLIQTKLRYNQQALAVLLNATNTTHGL